MNLIKRRLESQSRCSASAWGAAYCLVQVAYTPARAKIGWGGVELTEAGRKSPLRFLDGYRPVLHWHGDTFDLPRCRTAGLPVTPHQACAWNVMCGCSSIGNRCGWLEDGLSDMPVSWPAPQSVSRRLRDETKRAGEAPRNRTGALAVDRPVVRDASNEEALTVGCAFLYRDHTLEKWALRARQISFDGKRGRFLLMVQRPRRRKAVHPASLKEFVGQKHTLQMSFPKQDNPRGHSLACGSPWEDEKDG